MKSTPREDLVEYSTLIPVLLMAFLIYGVIRLSEGKIFPLFSAIYLVSVYLLTTLPMPWGDPVGLIAVAMYVLGFVLRNNGHKLVVLSWERRTG